MKHKIFTYCLLFGVVLLTSTGCKKLLEEQPRTSFTPTFFTTSDGIQGAISGIYASFRGQWSTQIWTQLFNGGTDEAIRGGSVDNSAASWFTYNNPVIKSNTNNYEGFLEHFVY